MPTKPMTLAVLFALCSTAFPLAWGAEVPMPELRIEPTTGGSIFYVKNVSQQPLTAYLIELVDYPGSSYSMWQDEAASTLLPPGGDQKITVGNMTVGAVPDYVKMQAAIYADGSTSGVPEKVKQLVERRRTVLETVRELIGRLEKAGSGADAKTHAQHDLEQWMASMEPLSKAKRNTQAGINQAASKEMITKTISSLRDNSVQEAIAKLKSAEQALAKSKPSLS